MAESKAPGIFAFDMDAKAEEKPDFPILTFDNSPYPDEVLTYSDIVLQGRRLARTFEKIGIGSGDTFSIVMRNHPEMVVAMYAASVLRSVMVPIDPRSKGEKLSFQIKNSGSKAVIFSAEFMEPMEEALANLSEVKTAGVMYREDFGVPLSSKYPNLNEILNGPEASDFSPDGHSENDPFMIIYTSGTTGDPKGVRVRNDRLGVYALLAQLVWQYTPDDRLYTGLSLTH
jgi:acyl-coenzyme A synthetase/AMP-(fatty) acid ligase